MKKITFILLILGFIFSQLYVGTFNISNGFKLYSFEFGNIIPLIKYNSGNYFSIKLSTRMIGYILFFIIGFINLSSIRKKNFAIVIITLLSGFAIYTEASGIYLDYKKIYDGREIICGTLLFTLGMYFYLSHNWKQKN